MFSKFIKKAKKTSRKEKNSLIGHSVRKLSFKANFFNPVLCSFFIILDVFSPLFIYQWTAG